MLFSIIIPVYNAQDTLAKCIDSVLSQKFDDFQLIISDDGSTDNSLEVANRYKEADKRISVIAEAHVGTGEARNRGFNRAEGEYILYLDADDYWVRDDLLLTLSDEIEKHRTDVFMFKMQKVSEHGEILKRYEKPEFQHDNMVLELKDIYSDLVRDGQVLASACNKCVRAELMRKHGVSFKKELCGEDIDWVLQLFSNVQTIYLMNMYAYAYTQNKLSRSHSRNAADDLATIVDEWATKLKGGNIGHARAVAGLTAFEYGICMGNNHAMSDDVKKLMRENEYLLKYGLDRKTKLIFRFYKIFGYKLTCLAIRIYLLIRQV